MPRLISARSHGTGHRVTFALDMIRRGNAILNRLENLRPSQQQSSASNTEQTPEGSQQAEAKSPSISPEGVRAPAGVEAPESSVPQSQTDPDSVNVYV